MFFQLCALLLLILFNYSVQDDPEYVKNYGILMNYSATEMASYIKNEWQLPNVRSNPSIVTWKYTNDKDVAVITWCSGNYACSYMLLEVGTWKIQKEVGWLEMLKNNSKLPHSVGDIRLFMFDNDIHIAYNIQPRGQLMKMHFAKMHYDGGSFYLNYPPHKLAIEHEMGNIHQKNWSPFEYFDEKANKSRLLFIYSVNPHRIVHANETDSAGVMKVNSICASKFANPKWNYGEMRGGSPAILVDTPYGPRYLTFFHSSGRFSIYYILTYYMGAYLFEAKPPFAITHITPHPIVPNHMYNETWGWAYRAIDYIIFPMGFIIRNNTIFLTVGRNDMSGWMVELNMTNLLSSLVPVRESVVSLNRYEQHMSIVDRDYHNKKPTNTNGNSSRNSVGSNNQKHEGSGINSISHRSVSSVSSIHKRRLRKYLR